MKAYIFLISCSLLCAFTANATPTLVVGTPGNSYLSTPKGPSPQMGVLANFDNLNPGPLASYLTPGVAVTSPDGFQVLPYSTQSGPNELFDNSSDGTANISIKLATGTSGIGIGIADGDPVSVTLQALNASGTVFGPVFSVNLAATQDPNNPGNGYYALFDTTSDIFGLQILQPTGSSNFSGLAIDDLQAVPEPASFVLLGAGAVLLGLSRLRRRA
ncbi:MAG: PEP-CTERM sorting domain-containing protein [Acidobacteriaceae bacterium]|nr:PEP-CTERM sorting domain-containing protein [Acidobacteriaceae bacterium]